MRLYELTNDYRALSDLAEQCEEQGYPEGTSQAVFAEAFDQLGDEFAVKIESCAALCSEWAAEASAATAEAKRLKKRAEVCENKAARLQRFMLQAMQDTDHKKIATPRFTVAVRKGSERVQIADDAELPDSLLRFTDPAPDKTAIKAAIKNGEQINGCSIVRGPEVLSIH